MQGIILCGGRGKRLEPMTSERPVSLLRLLGKEVIKYNIEYLKKNNVDQITLAVGYGAEQIRRYCDIIDCKDIKLDISYCNKNGTASAILYAANKNQENIIVYDGNCICDFPLDEMIDFHISNNSLCTALLNDYDDSYNKLCVCADEENRITSITKEPSRCTCGCDYCLAGVYIINKRIFEQCSFSENDDFNFDTLLKLCKEGNDLYGFKNKGFCQKLLTIKDVLNCQEYLLDNSDNKNIKSYNGVSLKDNVYIGKNVVIESGTIIGSNTVIDDNSVVRSKSIISNSYIGRNTVVSCGCEIYDSFICDSCYLDSAVKCYDFTTVGDRTCIGAESILRKRAVIPTDKVLGNNSYVCGSLNAQTTSYECIDDEGIFTLSQNILGDALKFGMAVASSSDEKLLVVIGYSENKNAEMISNAVKYGILTAGSDVICIGKAICSQVIYSTNRLNSKIGIFVDSGEHCKIKIFSKNGLPIKRNYEVAVERTFLNNSMRFLNSNMWGNEFFSDAEHIMYKNHICGFLPEYLHGYCVQIKTASSVTAKLVDEIFHSRNDINGERLIFNINCCGDKCSLYSERTGNVSWDKLICICILIMFEEGKSVAVPYTFPSSADWLAENKNGILYRFYNSPVDDSDYKGRLTAESKDNLFLTDPLILISKILGYIVNKKILLKKILDEIPSIYTTQRLMVSKTKSSAVRKALSLNNAGLSEGLIFENQNSRAIIRNLKNEKGLIIFAESLKAEQASSICDEIEEKIKMYESRKSNL